MWKLEGNVKVTVRNLEGEIIDTQIVKNIITTVGLNLVRNGLEGTITDSKIKYVAVGDNATAPAIGNTQLGNEVFRKPVTSFTEPGNGQLRTICYIAPPEAVGLINEIGWFAGATAGAGINTGVMVSRVLYNRTKTALESIQCERIDSISEA